MGVGRQESEGEARGEARAQEGPRSRALGGCVAAVELIALAAIFSMLGLHGGLWGLPAFAPLLAWMLACAVARNTLRPGAFARLRGGARLTATAFALAVFLTLWSSWSARALAAWHGHGGGLGVGGARSGGVPSLSGFPAGGGGGVALPSLPDPFPRLPYASVVSASPGLFAVVCVVLVALGMIAMPGRRRRRAGAGEAPAARGEAPAAAGEAPAARRLLAPDVELANGGRER